MAEHITGSVGIPKEGSYPHVRKPGNKTSDQAAIIRLLSKIPASQGGQQGAWSNPPPAGASGACTPALGDAIWQFQQHWKSKGVFKNIDGVVDPGGNTLRVMNTMLLGAQITAQGPNPTPPANSTNLNKLLQALRGEFPRASRWTLTNAPGFNVGFTAGVGISIGAGQLDVKEDGAAAQKYLTYASGGAEMGWSPEDIPVTFTASTRDMRSATELPGLSGMGRIFTRQANLSFEDMTGPTAIFGITGAAPNQLMNDLASAVGKQMLMGASLNVFLLGIEQSGKDALMRLPQTGNIYSGVMNAVKDCKAVCMSAGEVMGFDLSIGVSIGYATGMFDMITVPDWVLDNQKQAKGAFDNAEKTVKDTLSNAANNAWDKVKDWSPF